MVIRGAGCAMLLVIILGIHRKPAHLGFHRLALNILSECLEPYGLRCVRNG
jgi:hypothetical protein